MANDYIFVLISKHSLVKINYWKVITWLAWWIIAKALFLVNYGWWKSLLLKFFFSFQIKCHISLLNSLQYKMFFFLYTVTYLYSFSVWLQCLCGLMILYHNIIMIVCMYVCVWVGMCLHACVWVCVCEFTIMHKYVYEANIFKSIVWRVLCIINLHLGANICSNKIWT